MSETDPNRMDGAVPRDDIIDSMQLSENRVAYLDGFGTIHVAPPLSEAGPDEPLEREFALSPGESEQLGEFIGDS